MRKEWKNKQMNERTKQKSQCERDGQRFTLMRKWFACKSSNNHRNYRRAFLSAWKSEHAGNWNRKNFRFFSRYRNGIWRLFLVIKIWKMKRTSYAQYWNYFKVPKAPMSAPTMSDWTHFLTEIKIGIQHSVSTKRKFDSKRLLILGRFY